MIFLEIHNRGVEELLLLKFEGAKQGLKLEKFDYVLADFDGVLYRLHTVHNDKSKILISISLNFYRELQEYGADELLRREYGDHLCEKPENGASVSLLYDLESLPNDHAALARQIALLKRNCFAAVFERFFEFHALGDEAMGSKRAVIHYRADETLTRLVIHQVTEKCSKSKSRYIAKAQVFLSQGFSRIKRERQTLNRVLERNYNRYCDSL
ncbi:unnamed protein product [Echinostoma caproni]|uniref:Arp2/3 complex 34 kDa subunit n=1 Tax=Echinostoma caproni TaxID=27848 RepID=A0A183AUH6_9TREM|nr:unnamed protein product [Echinostoma caproni]